MMNTTNNHRKNSDQNSDETNYTIDANDLYLASQSHAECCCINFMLFLLMVLGLFCLFNYEPNVNLNLHSYKNKSNLTEIFHPLNKSNISSI